MSTDRLPLLAGGFFYCFNFLLPLALGSVDIQLAQRIFVEKTAAARQKTQLG